MKVAVIYNEPEPTNPSTHWLSRSNHAALPADFVDASEYGVLEHVAGITHALRDAGEQTTLHAAVSAEGLAAFLTSEKPDVGFNCCESFRDNAALEMSVAALFDLFGIAYTGSPALTLGLALDKGLSKALFRAHGIPTAPYIVARSPADLVR